jgi:hypothetical protein
VAAAKPAAKKPLKRGAPAAQPAAWLDDLCSWLAEGKTMREFCRQPNRPSYRTIYDKMLQDADVASRVACARDVGYDAIADECAQIADTPVLGRRTKRSDDGVEVVDEDALGHRKLQIETRLKLLACWNPKKYGNKQEVEHKGTMSVTISKDDAGVL